MIEIDKCQQVLKRYFLTDEGSYYNDIEHRSFTDILSSLECTHTKVAIFNEIVDFYKEVKDWKVLDIGCNVGYHSFLLAEKGAKVVGVDINAEFIETAVCMAKVRGLSFKGVNSDIESYLNASTEEFQLTLFLNVFHHLIFESEERAWRILKKVSERTKNMVFMTDLGAYWLLGGNQGSEGIFTKTKMKTADDLPLLILQKTLFTHYKRLKPYAEKNRDLWAFWRLG